MARQSLFYVNIFIIILIADQPQVHEEKELEAECCSPILSTKLTQWGLALDETVEVCLPTTEGSKLFTVRCISNDPTILEVDNFLSDQEVEFIKSTTRLKDSSTGYRDANGKRMQTEWRNSETGWRNVKEPQIQEITKRLSYLMRLPLALMNSSTFQVVHYSKGDYYFPHLDSRPLNDLGISGNKAEFPHRARYATALYYLNDPENGGGTNFPFAGHKNLMIDLTKRVSSTGEGALEMWKSYQCEAGITVPPRKGKALIFYNHRFGNGRIREIDFASFHTGCPVLSGEKWIANHWIQVPPKRFAKKGRVDTSEDQYLNPVMDMLFEAANFHVKSQMGILQGISQVWEAIKDANWRRFLSPKERKALDRRFKKYLSSNT